MTLSPFENDTQLAALLNRTGEVRRQIEKAERTIETASEYSYGQRRAAEAQEALPRLRDKLAALEAEAMPLHDNWNERRWARYFLVTNGTGHVHSHTSCSTCYFDTPFAWLPELADKTQDEMVEEFGEKACTVCFPTAPVNPRYHAPGRRDRATLDAKAAEKAAKLAAKLEKALLPDGSELRLSDPYDRPKTLIAAQRMLSSKLTDVEMDKLMVAAGHRAYNRAGETEDILTLAEAISAKTGEPVDALLKTGEAKAVKSAAKRWAESEKHAKAMGWS